MESAPWLAVGGLQGRWTDAIDLESGDLVWQADGTTGVVQAVEVVPVEQQMYNLTVAVAHTFFVGDGEWLVHNCINWKGFQKGKLQEHYQKHVLDQGEFGNISQNEYLQRARGFAQETSDSFQEAVVGNFNVKYDPGTGRVFVGHAKSREIRTFYIDDGRDVDPFQAAVNFAQELTGN